MAASIIGALSALAASAAGATGKQAAERRAHGVRLNALAHFDQPTFVGAPNGSRDLVYVTQRQGIIKLLDGEHKRGTSST